MNANHSLGEPEQSSQAGIKIRHPDDGLRILAKIIVQKLLAKNSSSAQKNDVVVNDKLVPGKGV